MTTDDRAFWVAHLLIVAACIALAIGIVAGLWWVIRGTALLTQHLS